MNRLNFPLLLTLFLLESGGSRAALPAQADPFPAEALAIGLATGACIASTGITQGLVRVEPGSFPPALTVLPGREAEFERLQKRCADSALREAGR